MASAALVATSAAPAAAIKYGEADDGEHPYVGLVILYVETPVDTDGDGEADDTELQADSRCTGTQMDADTFLTAGHCVSGIDAAAVWYGDDLQDVRASLEFLTFDEAIDQDSEFDADAWSADLELHPLYDDGLFLQHDSAVLDNMTLAEGTSFETYGQLPEQGYWDEQLGSRKKDRDAYTTVGYGLQWSTPPSNGQGRGDQADWLKLKAGGELLGNKQFFGGKLGDAFVVLSSNANTGGTCFGDSGGPTFVRDTSVVVGLTSFGVNTTCAGTSGVYRIDAADDLEWLSTFID